MALFLVKSSDIGAPTLSAATNGSFLTVADYALLTVAGYTKIFSGTNKGIYQPPNGLGYSIRFVHDSTVTGSTAVVGVRGLESATDVDTLTNIYPSVTQVTNANSTWVIGNSTSGTREYWWLISDGGTSGLPPFIFFSADATSGALCGQPQFWGEAAPQEASDNYCSLITVRGTAIGSGITADFVVNSIITFASTPKLYWARSHDGSQISSQGCLNDFAVLGGYTTTPFAPHPDTGGLIKRKVGIADACMITGSTPGAKFLMNRGWLPSMWSCMTGVGSLGFSLYDLFQDGNYNPSATFMFVPVGGSTSTANTTIFEITSTWRKPT